MGLYKEWKDVTMTGLPAFKAKKIDEYLWDKVKRERKSGVRKYLGEQSVEFCGLWGSKKHRAPTELEDLFK